MAIGAAAGVAAKQHASPAALDVRAVQKLLASP
jgi:hypothetical protein